MKYIKYFENMESKLYYEVPANGDFLINLYNDSVDMSRKNISLLLPLLAKYHPRAERLDSYGGNSYIQCKTTISPIQIIYPNVNFIMELIDEYFLISVRLNSHDRAVTTYKCDQMEGLMQFLKDNKLIEA